MFKSEAHRRKILELAKQGKIKPSRVKEWAQATGDKRLPERLHPKKSRKKGE